MYTFSNTEKYSDQELALKVVDQELTRVTALNFIKYAFILDGLKVTVFGLVKSVIITTFVIFRSTKLKYFKYKHTKIKITNHFEE